MPSDEAQILLKASLRDPLTGSGAGFGEILLQTPRTVSTRTKLMASRSPIPTVGWGELFAPGLFFPHFCLNLMMGMPVGGVGPAEVEWGHWVSLLQPPRGCQIGEIPLLNA
ncbi:hypothetical protein COLO4_06891 [Corchorus olitorius]|uniref:Uncharacterized protein n=1 Tax=Corchorus olitorius TaxID=93759 RepID=A0A1R3KLT5_9ROSI|nr:hypothetical protein COLO4_06891 [Corchorus olitorius]